MAQNVPDSVDFPQIHWGDLLSALGLAASVLGLTAAAWAALNARSARQAAVEARDRIGRSLAAADLERSVALIQRLKLLHRNERWEAALEQYQALRAMLSSILVRHADLKPGERARLVEARALVTYMEQQVDEALADGERVENLTAMNSRLNRIQSDLEDMAGAVGFGM